MYFIWNISTRTRTKTNGVPVPRAQDLCKPYSLGTQVKGTYTVADCKLPLLNADTGQIVLVSLSDLVDYKITTTEVTCNNCVLRGYILTDIKVKYEYAYNWTVSLLSKWQSVLDTQTISTTESEYSSGWETEQGLHGSWSYPKVLALTRANAIILTDRIGTKLTIAFREFTYQDPIAVEVSCYKAIAENLLYAEVHKPSYDLFVTENARYRFGNTGRIKIDGFTQNVGYIHTTGETYQQITVKTVKELLIKVQDSSAILFDLQTLAERIQHKATRLGLIKYFWNQKGV